MDSTSLRKQFAEFAGPQKLDEFMAALHRNPVCRNRLLFWQEKLWEAFRERSGLEEMDHAGVVGLFTCCHLHGRDLSDGSAGNITSHYDEHRDQSSFSYREAWRRLEWRCFPFAEYPPTDTDMGSSARARHCPDCAEAKRRYVEGAHRASPTLADRDRVVCDIEQECLEIYDRLGEDFEGGRMEGLGLYYVEHRPEAPPRDPALADLVVKMDQTARWILASVRDLLLEGPPDLERLGRFLQEGEGGTDTDRSLEELKLLFDLEVESRGDRETLMTGRRLFFVLCELGKELQ